MFRLLLAGVFFVLLEVFRSSASGRTVGGAEAFSAWWIPSLAAVIFTVAATTDALDGILARRWAVQSRFGRVMDPFADKVLVLGAFVMLAGPGFATSAAGGHAGGGTLTGVEPWMVVVILARELLVTSLRGLVESSGGDFSASAAGKIKMVAQSIAVPMILLITSWSLRPDGPTWGVGVNAGIAWTATVATAVSALPYIRRAVRSLEKGPVG